MSRVSETEKGGLNPIRMENESVFLPPGLILVRPASLGRQTFAKIHDMLRDIKGGRILETEEGGYSRRESLFSK